MERKSRASFVTQHQLWSTQQAHLAEALLQELQSTRSVQWVRVVFPDAHGVLRGKTLSKEAAIQALTAGHGAPSSLLLKDSSGRTVFPIFEAPERLPWPQFRGAADLVMVPDPSTWRVLPWVEATGWLMADVYFPDGRPVPIAPRHILRRQLDRFREAGYLVRVGVEVECYVWPQAAPNAPTEGLRPQLLGVDRLDQLDAVIRVLQRGLCELGLPLRSVEAELGPGQLEVTLEVLEGMEAADAVALLRAAVRQLCRTAGYQATFMCRPPGEGMVASGWHVHQSLVDLNQGHNRFAPGPGEVGPLSQVGMAYLAGLLAHAPAGAAFAVPTITGYKRFLLRALAPDRVSWGEDNRAAMVRVAQGHLGEAVHLEHRLAEPQANPYLWLAAQLASGWDGMVRALSPGVPDAVPYAAEGPRLPTSLREALDRLREDATLAELLGHDVVQWFIALKEAEWRRFAEAVTDWEVREYLDLC